MGNLRDKYCIVGVGETEYTKNSGRTTRALGTEAIRNALADAGLRPEDVDGMMSYSDRDSTASTAMALDLGIQLNFYMDCQGGGSSTEALVGLAMGAIEAGMAHTIVIFRAMNGYSGVRIGGTPTDKTGVATKITGQDLDTLPYGYKSAAQKFQFAIARHMHEYGTTNEQLAHIRVVHSKHAANNPKAYFKDPVTVDDVLSSRWISKPATHLLDCCLETDNATCIIVTSAERARNLRQRPVYVKSVAGRVTKPFPSAFYHYQCDPITRQAGEYAARTVFRNAGVGPEDIQITGAYDAFTFTTLFLLEGYGFCERGEGGDYVTSGAIELGGIRPNNTSGGLLCEGYTNGMSLVIENVRQLRHEADDYCEVDAAGRRKHTYDYSAGCRQVKDAELAMSMGESGVVSTTSALILGGK
ncbi:thiolase C-terminal domain-containing protein [Microbacterium sp. A196]|uniref:thiolase C-terminal domain-containing protein n=1 Tax=unclassified Microbacterium TaxID=2609290 RepID=UPI003F336582